MPGLHPEALLADDMYAPCVLGNERCLLRYEILICRSGPSVSP